MSRGPRAHSKWLGALGASALLLATCSQPRDHNAARGSPVTPGRMDQPGDEPGGPPEQGTPPGQLVDAAVSSPDVPLAASDDAANRACEQTRSRARAILETNCAGCHQAPAKQGNFDFCLDIGLLTSAISSTGKRFVVPGAPGESRLYQRVSAGEMPPAMKMPRPSQEDIALLRAWITDCADGPGLPDGGLDVQTGLGDSGVGSGCGEPGQECCLNNVCNRGGCCVLGQCKANGQACGAGGEGIPGMCTDGGCQNGGQTCGKVAQPCCGGAGCTGPRASCVMATTCQTCGDLGQPCCWTGGAGTCLAGLDCQGAGFMRAGSCQPCGADGKPCCGNGPVALQTCDPNLTCRFVAGMGDRCGP